jgi:hypothetical protein
MPYDLEVASIGSGVAPDTFEAWLDEGETYAQDITSAFTLGNGKWTAPGFELPVGSHTFTVLGMGTGGLAKDSRQIFVDEPTCIQGKVLGHPQGQDPSSAQPIPASISVTLYGELVAEGEAGDDGTFCIDNIPSGYLVDASVAFGIATKSIEGFDPGPPRLCPDPDCADICKDSPEVCRDGCIIVPILED